MKHIIATALISAADGRTVFEYQINIGGQELDPHLS